MIMLKSAAVWAVVGDVLNASKPASRVVARLQANNKYVHLINPRAAPEDCFPTLAAAHEVKPIEAVNLIINPKIGPAFIDEMIALEIPNLFIQPGAAPSDDVLERASSAGITIQHGCVLVEMPESP